MDGLETGITRKKQLETIQMDSGGLTLIIEFTKHVKLTES